MLHGICRLWRCVALAPAPAAAAAYVPFKCRRARLKYAKLFEYLVNEALTPSASSQIGSRAARDLPTWATSLAPVVN